MKGGTDYWNDGASSEDEWVGNDLRKVYTIDNQTTVDACRTRSAYVCSTSDIWYSGNNGAIMGSMQANGGSQNSPNARAIPARVIV